MGFIDLGEKLNGTAEVSLPRKKEKYYPSFHVSETELPIQGTQVGKEITATVKLKVRSIEKRENERGKKLSYDFNVIAINLPKTSITPADTQKMIEDELTEASEKKES